jgi:transcription initiation factor IIE alpha subunit
MKDLLGEKAGRIAKAKGKATQGENLKVLKEWMVQQETWYADRCAQETGINASNVRRILEDLQTLKLVSSMVLIVDGTKKRRFRNSDGVNLLRTKWV